MYRYRDKKLNVCYCGIMIIFGLLFWLNDLFNFFWKNEIKLEKCCLYIIINNFFVKKKVIIFGCCYSLVLNIVNNYWKINVL